LLEHGGNLQAAVRRYGIPSEAWIDLSTGINPHAYPVPALAADAWHRLPEDSEALLSAARDYYGAQRLIAVAGSQAAIQGLPQLRVRHASASRVVVAEPSYAEHAHQWRRAGHAVRAVAHADLADAVAYCDVMVVCNPNNPTGETVAPATLLQWAAQLAERGGWLIVDEAFGDVLPASSVAGMADRAGLIVLRSVGKFFGLAGLRLGFVVAEQALLDALAEELGPWSVSGPAQEIGALALRDHAWQETTRANLCAQGQRLHAMLTAFGFPARGCDLFQYWPQPDPAALADHLAAHGIWIRRFSHGVRLGLPAHEDDWQKLQAVLAAWKDEKE